jgi:hypothetical protein
MAGILAAALLILSAILTQVATPGTTLVTTTDYVQQVVRATAFIAVLVAVVGVHGRHRDLERFGRLGTIGTVLTLLGYAAVTAVVLAGIVAGERVLTDLRLGGAALVLVGSALLGIAVLRARALPWWCGLLLIVTFPLGDVADTVVAGAEGLLFAVLWGSTGMALLRPRAVVARPPGVRASRAPSTHAPIGDEAHR